MIEKCTEVQSCDLQAAYRDANEGRRKVKFAKGGGVCVYCKEALKPGKKGLS
jgi:hypothetical protein